MKSFLSAILVLGALHAYSQNTLTVTIITDCWGGEVSWGIYDSGNNQVAGVGPNTLGNSQTYSTAVELADGCYEFRINDSYGDGMYGEQWGGCGINGNYYLTDDQGAVVAEMTAPNADYGYGAVHAFCLPFVAVPGCMDPNAYNYDPAANVDDGSCFGDPLEAAFSFELNGGCAGTSVSFTDGSTGYSPATLWEWSFPGGEPGSSQDQNPLVVYNNPGIYTASVTVSNAVGEMSVISHEFEISVGNDLDIVINPDNYPNEISWELIDPFGNVVANGGSVGSSVCIGGGCYVFTIYDSYGDGICCGYGIGSYELILNGVEIATGGNYAYSETQYVNCPAGVDCNNPIDAAMGLNTAPDGDDWFRFIPDVNGQYLFSTCDYTACNSVIWIYDYCNMANFDDTNEATLTYNDNFCGDQAEVTPYLEGGAEYLIRIGSADGSCDGTPLDFIIDYIGGIPGCMNQAACNYLPIATEPTPCYYPGDPECPEIGPDLEVLGDVFYSTMYFTTLTNNDACYINEGCMQGFGTRQIIRFTTHIKNIGNEDYFIGDPGDQPDQFEWDVCHNHWHYEGYAEYVLFDENGFEMPQIGFKNGFCVLDLECSGGGIGKYTCGNMGITAGCGDIYSSGLSCQWIDITDVPAGTYTLVIRTNWDFSPDANGSFELRYDNNWAAVCISFDRDANNNVVNFTKSQDCPLIVDCLGMPFGNSQPDCAGNCPGLVVRGDVNGSGELEVFDASQYAEEILGNDALVSPCTDMDNDGNITVTDIALITGCVFYGPDHVDENGIHNHCVYNDEVVNPNHNVTFSVGDVNTDLGYVDIHILNPDNKVVAYELDVSGFTILSAENLYDPALWDVLPLYNLGGSRILGYSTSDQQVPKNYSPIPFVRLYYFQTNAPEACVSAIIDVVNEDYHNVLTTIGSCGIFAEADVTDFVAEPTATCQGTSVSFTDLSTHNPIQWSWSFEGGSPAFSEEQNPVITYNEPGVYNVTLTASNGDNTDSETKTAYIEVLPSANHYEDADGDGFGNPLVMQFTCVVPPGYVEDNTDCDDSNGMVYPGAAPTQEGLDNNCDGLVDEWEQAPCVGDLNSDQVINVADLLLLLSEIGCMADCLYDMNADGIVNTADMLAFLALYGQNCD